MTNESGMKKNEQYLGDGLYASFDGWMITLRAPRERGDHWVGLEGPVLHEFLRFAHQINPEVVGGWMKEIVGQDA